MNKTIVNYHLDNIQNGILDLNLRDIIIKPTVESGYSKFGPFESEHISLSATFTYNSFYLGSISDTIFLKDVVDLELEVENFIKELDKKALDYELKINILKDNLENFKLVDKSPYYEADDIRYVVTTLENNKEVAYEFEKAIYLFNQKINVFKGKNEWLYSDFYKLNQI